MVKLFIDRNSDKTWKDDDLNYHRNFLPAGIHKFGTNIRKNDNIKYYFKHGKRHRLEGPAINYCDGAFMEWWFEGEKINCETQIEFERLIKLRILW